jgi:hypothetical protein
LPRFTNASLAPSRIAQAASRVFELSIEPRVVASCQAHAPVNSIPHIYRCN